MSELIELVLRGSDRIILVCLCDMDLTSSEENVIMIFVVQEGHGSAGGRAAGYGSRKISKIICFLKMKDRVNKLFESEQEQTISKFEIPYSAVAMDIKLSDGTTKVLQGLVDPALIQSYFNLMENSLHLTLDIPDRLRKVLQL
ncbi:MAG TPA: hypothetical protein VH415_01460 [Nitrososphaeraceae archaeon]